jgi:GNAT superfamily N-acetyltransferase
MVRVLRADVAELRLYGEHLKNLTDEDKSMRFGYKVNDHAIDQLILKILYSPDDHKLWIARKGSHIVGWGHLARDTSSAWELAVSVENEYQGQGFGNRLIGEMLEWAKVHHIEEVYMHCIESNKRVQHLAAKHNLQTRDRSPGERTAAMTVPDPSVVDINVQKWKEHSKLMQDYVELRNRLFELWIK